MKKLASDLVLECSDSLSLMFLCQLNFNAYLHMLVNFNTHVHYLYWFTPFHSIFSKETPNRSPPGLAASFS